MIKPLHDYVLLEKEVSEKKVGAILLTKEEKKAYLSSLKGASLASDGFFPFRDNIDRAAKSAVCYVAEPGGSTRDDDIISAADEHGMVLVFTNFRLFHH